MPEDTLTAAEGEKPSLKAPAPTRDLRLVFAALALRGRLHISALVEAAGALGARETQTRAFSKPSLKRALEPYIAAGWVLHSEQGYECNWGLGPRVLRSASVRFASAQGNRARSALADCAHIFRLRGGHQSVGPRTCNQRIIL